MMDGSEPAALAAIRAARGFCVVGNLCVDLVIREVPALPAWGQEVAGRGQAIAPGGQAANLARALARLGAPVAVAGVTGDDGFGRAIREDLAAHGVDVSAVVTLPGPTPLTVGIVRPDGERAFVSEFGCAEGFDAGLLDRLWPAISGADVICLVGQFNLPALSPGAAQAALARARAAGAVTVVDTGWDPGGWPPATAAAVRQQFGAADIVLPNRDEAAALTGEAGGVEAAAALLAAGPELVVVKLGEEGSLARFGDQAAFAAPFPVQAADAVGAGDVFDGGFLHALRQGLPVAEALVFGNAAAALYVERVRDRFPATEEVLSRVAARARGSGESR
ncbi:MAG: carbohydrate kinase family protein [Chloroflexota bacterium]